MLLFTLFSLLNIGSADPELGVVGGDWAVGTVEGGFLLTEETGASLSALDLPEVQVACVFVELFYSLGRPFLCSGELMRGFWFPGFFSFFKV